MNVQLQGNLGEQLGMDGLQYLGGALRGWQAGGWGLGVRAGLEMDVTPGGARGHSVLSVRRCCCLLPHGTEDTDVDAIIKASMAKDAQNEQGQAADEL